MAKERKQVGGALPRQGVLPAITLNDLVSVVEGKTPYPLESGNLSLHGRIGDLTHRGVGFVPGESTFSLGAGGGALRIRVNGVLYERVQSRGTWLVGRDGRPVYSILRAS